MKKLILIVFMFLMIIFISLLYSKNSHKYCLNNSYDISYVTDTINTFGRNIDNGHIWLMRGDIKYFYDDEEYFFGYLSTKNFKNDGLIGVEEKYDKEGYFIVNLKTGKIESGLSQKRYSKKLFNYLKINLDTIAYRKFPSFSLTCYYR